MYPVCLASDAFQSAPSTRRATRRTPHKAASPSGFNPRPPRGGRPDGRPLDPNHHWFQSAPSTRRATCRVVSAIHDDRVSIRALHAEGDTPDLVSHSGALHVSIRALHAEGDPYVRPPRGGRQCWAPVGSSFNPRPPRGGRPAVSDHPHAVQSAPSTRRATLHPAYPFQSAPSTRRATSTAAGGRQSAPVSIRALHAEGDPEYVADHRGELLVSIRALHAEGDMRTRPVRSGRGTLFQSAPSTRRATGSGRCAGAGPCFNPRPPRGGRPRSMQPSAREDVRH